MATTLGQKFDVKWQGVPPHMSKEDYEIWTRWRDRALDNAVGVFYDVGLGSAEIPAEITDPNLGRMWQRLNQKRADVIIEYPAEVRIVELRYNARLDTVGRLVGYGILYADDPPFKKIVKLTIVTNSYDSDVERTAHALGIEYVVA